MSMSSAKQKRYQNKSEKAIISDKREKLISDLLLQFAYTLTICVLSIFVYNATGLVQYGNGVLHATRGILWAVLVASLGLGIFLTLMVKNKGKVSCKTGAIYSFVTAVIMFWYVAVENIPYFLSKYIPFFKMFASRLKILIMIFPLLGVAVILEFALYFIKYYNTGKEKK